jgi:lysophospholipase L1-like esterase
MRTSTKRLIILAINAALFVVLFAFMEFGVRVIQSRRLGPKALAPSNYMDRWTAWRNAPGYARIDIHHNAQGFRHEADVAVSKAPSTVRIFFAGGSAAYGCEGLFQTLDPQWERLYNRDLINAYLERKLKERHPERQWEVVNVATNEYRMHQHLALLYTRLLRYKPDLVIFMDGHNDLSGIISSTTNPYDPYVETPHGQEFVTSVYPHTLRDWLFINTQWLRNRSSLFALAQAKVLAGRRDEAFGIAPDAGQSVTTPVRREDLTPALQQRARENLAKDSYYAQAAERLQSVLAHEGVESLFSMQPELILGTKPVTPVEARFAEHYRRISGRYTVYMYEQMRPAVSRQMAASAERNGYTYVDLIDIFRQVKEKTFTDYCHLTPKGNQLIAERLYQAMTPSLIPKLVAASGVAAPSASR